MQVNVKKLHPDAILPTYGTDGAACFDIYSLSTHEVDGATPIIFSTGIAFEIPKGYVLLIFSRSGHGFNYNVRLANCVGVIDSDYRGELMIKLTGDNPKGYFNVKYGDRIAQGMIIPVVQNTFTEVEELSNTTRGTGGLGSTGN